MAVEMAQVTVVPIEMDITCQLGVRSQIHIASDVP